MEQMQGLIQLRNQVDFDEAVVAAVDVIGSDLKAIVRGLSRLLDCLVFVAKEKQHSGY